MIVKEINTKDYVTKSNLPYCDYVINPYGGCTHACKYCYASFMKRFTGHTEEWGTFLDIKCCEKPLSAKKLTGKTVFMSSVTDPYNAFEKKYKITQKLLEQLKEIDCKIKISTKSSLILRDLNLLLQQKHMTVAVSLNTLDESFRGAMDRGASVQERLKAMRTLHESGIYTVLFMSPIFPGITDYQALIEETKDFVDEYWFENLNLRGDYKKVILQYIQTAYPQLAALYDSIYNHSDDSYWNKLENDFIKYCGKNDICFVNAFYHSKLVKDKKQGMLQGE